MGSQLVERDSVTAIFNPGLLQDDGQARK